LPALAIERWTALASASPAACPPDAAVALTIEAAHGPVLHAVTSAAAKQGAVPGMRLTDARALNPALAALPADPAGDRALLDRLARWSMRWSPLVEVDGEDGLRLDVAGAAHLFGGEAGLIRDMEQAFERLGLTLRIAIAPTPGAAWALSRFGPSSSIVTPAKAGVHADANRPSSEKFNDMDASLRWHDELRRTLAPLPVAALRLPPPATRTLERLGLKTIGTLAGIERRSLARRFREADNPLDALDRALGKKPEPLTAIARASPPRSTLRLAEPVTDPAAGPQALHILVPRLVAELEARKLGARHLSLTGFRVDGSIASVAVATAIPSRDPAHLQRLLADKAAALDPGFGVDAFALTADWAEPLGAAQESLVDDPAQEDEIARLVDRLSVKLGASRVRRPNAVASHLPERSSGWVSALADRPASSRKREGRPQRLLDRAEAIAVVYATPEGLPRRFVWRRAVHDIARVAGPERIAPEWWRQPGSARLRDYYQVEDVAGRRYWIYREGVAGDGRGGAPGWFIHGLFG
jgi:protein ImuB